jgi:hypothetical protein
LDVTSLKEHIFNEDLSEQVLESIGCHNIIKHGNDYITCANKDGDNKNAIVLYLNENLTVINYTRAISKTKRTTDIIDLVMFNENCGFPEALKFICGAIGIDYYNNDVEDMPESLQIIKMIFGMNTGDGEDDNTPLKPINEKSEWKGKNKKTIPKVTIPLPARIKKRSLNFIARKPLAKRPTVIPI